MTKLLDAASKFLSGVRTPNGSVACGPDHPLLIALWDAFDDADEHDPMFPAVATFLRSFPGGVAVGKGARELVAFERAVERNQSKG